MRSFSMRTAWDTTESAFAGAIRKARSEGRVIADLTISNPTVCGFVYDTATVVGALADRGSMVYDADPRGMLSAREAVCGYYREHGAAVAPDQVILTTSTSEGYGHLFRLLCDPGDEVLVPQPGYPLFDFLADLQDVRLRTYPLFHDFGWWIDFAELERQISQRTKAILLVHPANPTGHWTWEPERARLEEICARFGLALIVDEVFLDYGILGEPGGSFAARHSECLTFVLSGLSKIAGLPQMKVAWVVALGPASLREKALQRLEVIADTFLSMGAPSQHALPLWLQGRRDIQAQIVARVKDNADILRRSDVRVMPIVAGWSAVLRLARAIGGADQVLEERGVIVHPGSFYGLSGQSTIVVSLIGRPEDLAAGLTFLR